MPPTAPIYYLRHHEIDKPLWDACINKAANGLIYAQSFYLDIMCGQWDALVLNNYEAVMPLVWRKKYGIYYLYQPYFTAALGVFGNNISPQLITDFLTAIPSKFVYWDMDLNEANTCVPDTITHLHITQRTNFILPLQKHYEAVYAGYSRRAKRMLNRAETSGLTVIKNAPPEIVIDNYIHHYQHRHIIPPDAYQNLITLARQASTMGHMKTYIAQTADKEIVAFLLCLADERFIYAVLGGGTPEGKQQGAFTLLIDAVLKEQAGSGKIFRFEGSDHMDIAFFNEQFGAQEIHYPHLKKNNLPWPLHYLKK